MPTYDLGLEHVSLSFATTTIFDDVTQGVFEADRIGIVGRNGEGKSTLLHLLAGNQEPDSGRVSRRGGLTFGMLDQGDRLDGKASVRQAALDDREDYLWAADASSRDIVEALLDGIDLEATVDSLSGGQRRRADLARLLLHDWDILALDEPTNHLDVVTIQWLAEHLKHRWSSGQGALLVVTHDRWFLDEVCSSMWEVHDGRIDPFEGGYSAYMLQRVERERQADVREERRRNLARKELAWLSRGARARSTKQKFHVKQAREIIADVPPMRDSLTLRQMATSRLGKQVVDLVGVTHVYQAPARPSQDPSASVGDGVDPAGSMDVIRSSGGQDELMGAVEICVDRMDDPRLRDAGYIPTRGMAQVGADGDGNDEGGSDGFAAMEKGSQESGSGSSGRTCAARRVTVRGRKVLDDVTWLIGPGDRIGIVGANGAGKSTLLGIIDGMLTPTVGRVSIGKTVRFAVLSQRLEELDELRGYRIQEVLSRYKASYVVDGKEVTPGQLMERLGFESAQLMTRIGDLSGGQRRRMRLLLILLDEPNVLIMDEPGNDLDTDMLAVMEDLLDTWAGTLIVVSHDRYLLERVTDQQFALIDGGIRHLPGGVDDYLTMVRERRSVAARSDAAKRASAAGRRASAANGGMQTAQDAVAAESSGKRSDRAQRDGTLSGKAFHDASKRVSAIERRLSRLGQSKKELEERMATHDPSDYMGLGELSRQLDDVSAEADALEEEWMELSERLG